MEDISGVATHRERINIGGEGRDQWARGGRGPGGEQSVGWAGGGDGRRGNVGEYPAWAELMDKSSTQGRTYRALGEAVEQTIEAAAARRSSLPWTGHGRR
ncbi:hypothetical protein FKP32DRAFT_1173183 [Trametes sanguinea]|nr:hypothetical protein FKP32DRAFT_1173183 [Trametes sanguinea]